MRSPSSLIAAWALAVGTAANVVVASPAAAQIGAVEVRSVRFEGNHAFPDDSLARAIVTRGNECRSVVFTPACWLGWGVRRQYLRQRELPLDQLRLKVWYQRRGYREAEIDTLRVVHSDGSVDVTFEVDEGRPVRVDSIEVVGLDPADEPQVARNLPLRVGDRLSQIALDATRDTLVRRLANRGHARADVLRSFRIPAEAPYAARVAFDVDPGPVARYGHIEVTGARQLSEGVVLRTLRFRRGDLYRADQLLEAQARLFGMELLRNAKVEPDVAAASDSVIPIHVTIQEGDVHRVRGGGGWSSSECFNTEASWTSRNFLGGGRRLQVRGRLSNVLAQGFHELLCPQSGGGAFGRPNWLTSVDFAQPFVFSGRNSLSASLFSERQSLPDVFVRQTVGLSVALTRAIGPGTPLTLSYRPELSTLDAAEFLFCTGFLVCAPEDIDVLQGANWLAPVGLNFTRNRANNLLNPSRGYSLVLDLEHAANWTGSDFLYDRAIAEGSWYHRVGPRGVFASRLRGGWVRAGSFAGLLGGATGSLNIVHPQKRFYAGGANSVRGFAQNRLGPRVLTVSLRDLVAEPGSGGVGCSPQQVMDLTCDASALAEGRFDPRPVGGTRVLEGNVEFRVYLGRRWEGVTFTDFGQVWGNQDDVDLHDLEFTPGLGVRYLSPIGPIRMDVAYRFRAGEDLSVITSQIRPFDPTRDEDSDQILPGWVRSAQLAVLTPRVLFGDSSPGSLSRIQLHISIGQAF